PPAPQANPGQAPPQGWPAPQTAGPPPGAWPPPGGAPAGAMPPAAPPPVAAPPPGPTVVQTDEKAKDGLAKCARCGATQISLNIATGNLRCHFCRYETEARKALEVYNLDGDPSQLFG